jgi:hypothetical protein
LPSLSLNRRRSSVASRPLSVAGSHPRDPKGRDRYQTERAGLQSPFTVSGPLFVSAQQSLAYIPMLKRSCIPT